MAPVNKGSDKHKHKSLSISKKVKLLKKPTVCAYIKGYFKFKMRSLITWFPVFLANQSLIWKNGLSGTLLVPKLPD